MSRRLFKTPYQTTDGRVHWADLEDPKSWSVSIVGLTPKILSDFDATAPSYIVTHRASGFQMQAITIAEAKRQILMLLALPERYHPKIRRLLDAEQYAQAIELARSLTGVG